jgi:hypothetical protein
MKQIAFALLLCLALPACSVVELAVHGVKEYEKSRDKPGAAPAIEKSSVISAERSETPSWQDAPAPVPTRDYVSVEPLK